MPEIETLTGDALRRADDGELYLEYTQSESLVFDDGQLKSASFDTAQGFGVRAVAGDAVGYAHSGALDEGAIRRACDTVQAVIAGSGGASAEAPIGTNAQLYVDDNPLSASPFDEKVALLQQIDAYARTKDKRVQQVIASLSGEWSAVQIIRGDGWRGADVRPLVRLNVSVVVADGDRMETGSMGAGGRVAYDLYLRPETWQSQVDEALRQALVNLGSVDAPAGEMKVVLGPGWPGVHAP